MIFPPLVPLALATICTGVTSFHAPTVTAHQKAGQSTKSAKSVTNPPLGFTYDNEGILKTISWAIKKGDFDRTSIRSLAFAVAFDKPNALDDMRLLVETRWKSAPTDEQIFAQFRANKAANFIPAFKVIMKFVEGYQAGDVGNRPASTDAAWVRCKGQIFTEDSSAPAQLLGLVAARDFVWDFNKTVSSFDWASTDHPSYRRGESYPESDKFKSVVDLNRDRRKNRIGYVTALLLDEYMSWFSYEGEPKVYLADIGSSAKTLEKSFSKDRKTFYENLVAEDPKNILRYRFLLDVK